MEETLKIGNNSVVISDKDAIIASLMESVDCLREEIARVRTNNRILRRVHSALRSANASLKAQVVLAEQNDNLFKQFCGGEFDAKVPSLVDGGFPEAGSKVETLG